MPGYLPPHGYKDPYKDSKLTYRASLLPIGTYADPNGGNDTLGFAVPGMVQEPMNALMRLLGTPSQPGSFTQGPGYGSNSEDMRTLLETFLGGQATRGAGAVERAAPDIGFLDSLKGKYLDYMHPDEYAPIGGSRMVRDYAGGNPSNGMPLDPTVVSGLLNHHTPGFMGFPANSARGWTPSVVNSETGKPSLWGAMINALTGGNATRGMGAVERGAMEAPAPRAQTLSTALFPDVLETQGIKRTQAGGGETWASESPFGFVYGRLDPNEGAVRIKSSQVDEAARGQGHGIDLYRRLIDAAHADGLPVISDRNISSAAQNIYPALERRGYQVEYNPNPNGHQGGHFIRPQGYDGPAFFSDQLPSLPGAVIAGADNTPIRAYRGSARASSLAPHENSFFSSSSPDVAGSYAEGPAGAMMPVDLNFSNPMTVDAQGNLWDRIPFENKKWATTDDLMFRAKELGHDGLIVRNVIDDTNQSLNPATTYAALKRGTVTSPLTGETLFANGIPSLWGSALQGDQQPYPNSLFTY